MAEGPRVLRPRAQFPRVRPAEYAAPRPDRRALLPRSAPGRHRPYLHRHVAFGRLTAQQAHRGWGGRAYEHPWSAFGLASQWSPQLAIDVASWPPLERPASATQRNERAKRRPEADPQFEGQIWHRSQAAEHDEHQRGRDIAGQRPLPRKHTASYGC